MREWLVVSMNEWMINEPDVDDVPDDDVYESEKSIECHAFQMRIL
jgi:hypothetical protein